jgi:hypothetical protein
MTESMLSVTEPTPIDALEIAFVPLQMVAVLL